MPYKPTRLKWSKKERNTALTGLIPELKKGQLITCIPANNKPTDWIFLVPMGNKIQCISEILAGTLELPYATGILRGPKYTSPAQIIHNLQEALGYDKPFQIEVLGDTGKND